MAKVERRHRELVQHNRFCGMTDDEKHWVETGEVRGFGSVGFPLAAQLVADAEARGYAACQSDVVAWLESEAAAWKRTHEVLLEDGATNIDPESAINADTIEMLATRCRAGDHVGKAKP